MIGEWTYLLFNLEALVSRSQPNYRLHIYQQNLVLRKREDIDRKVSKPSHCSLNILPARAFRLKLVHRNPPVCRMTQALEALLRVLICSNETFVPSQDRPVASLHTLTYWQDLSLWVHKSLCSHRGGPRSAADQEFYLLLQNQMSVYVYLWVIVFLGLDQALKRPDLNNHSLLDFRLYGEGARACQGLKYCALIQRKFYECDLARQTG